MARGYPIQAAYRFVFVNFPFGGMATFAYHVIRASIHTETVAFF